VNAPCSGKNLFPLSAAGNAAILTALLDRGADPTSGGDKGVLPLMTHVIDGKLDCIHRLLQEPRVLANIDAHVVGNFLNGEGRLIEWKGMTALHFAYRPDLGVAAANSTTAPAIELLLQAGANPLLVDLFGRTPLDLLREYLPTNHAAISLLAAASVEPQRTFLLAKARHQIDTSHVCGRVAAISQGRTRGETTRTVLTRTPCDLKERVKKRRALPRVELQPAAEQQRAMLEYVLRTDGSGEGLGVMEREGLPAELFVELLNMMMSRWDPLRASRE